MKYFGSVVGLISGNIYHFDKDEIIEAKEGEFNSDVGEAVEKPKAKRKKKDS